MSQPLADAAGIDWKLVGSAVGVFFATILTTVWGWMQGRKKSEKASAAPESQFQFAGAVLQDNTSLRENTQATRELRDQILLLIHILEKRVKVEDDIEEHLEALLKRLDKAS